MEKKRSKGVTAFGALAIGIGLFQLLPCISQIAQRIFPLFIIFPLGLIVSGVFVIKLSNWARILYSTSLCIETLWLGLPVFGLSSFNSKFSLSGWLFFVFIFITSILFFMNPKVKEQFE